MADILIVEDERIIAMDLEILVRELGHEVTGIATNGEDAIRMASAGAPHLALMDIRLAGDMDGIETAAELRARFDIPVIYVTAYASERTVERAKITEPAGYIVKPFTLKTLRATLGTALYRIDAEQRRLRRTEWLATALRNVDQAVFMVGSDGLVQHVNASAEELIGLDAGDLIGVPLADVAGTLSTEQRETLGTLVLPDDNDELDRLSEREREVFDLLLTGYAADEVAEILDISVHTARNHRKAIFAKLRVHSQVKLMRNYLQLDALDVSQ